MSVIFLTDHDENIYGCTKKQQIKRTKSPMYISKHREKVKVDIEKAKPTTLKPYATMGLPQLPPPNPKEYLKKAASQQRFEEMRKRLAQPAGSKSPSHVQPVPKLKDLLEEEKKRKQSTYKNFVKRNIKKASQLKVTEPTPQVVYNNVGDKKLLAYMEPVFIHLPTMGKTPEYLTKFTRARDKEYHFKKDSSDSQQPICRYITKAERDTLLQGLKKNWEDLQRQYQLLPIVTDTIPKINRKLKLEKDLKQIETDIVSIERHPYLYVYDDDYLE